MKKIALEEAFIVPQQEKMVAEHLSHPEFKDRYSLLLDLTQQRLQAMEQAEVAVSVLSITSPGIQALNHADHAISMAKQWNDYTAEAIAKHSNRLKAFAVLPTREPEAACAELERCIKSLGFLGALINGFDNAGGLSPMYLDAEVYLPLWQKAAELNVPIYIHPRSIPSNQRSTYDGYDELRGAAWGFHIETAEHVLRLILSGLFDKIPSLKIIIGHVGEMLPFWAWRIDHRIAIEGWRDNPKTVPRRYTVSEYLKRNVYITTSGCFDNAAFEHTYKVMGPDRLMYAMDYPYEDCQKAADWFENLPISDSDKQKIAYENAATLLGLNS